MNKRGMKTETLLYIILIILFAMAFFWLIYKGVFKGWFA